MVYSAASADCPPSSGFFPSFWIIRTMCVRSRLRVRMSSRTSSFCTPSMNSSRESSPTETYRKVLFEYSLNEWTASCFMGHPEHQLCLDWGSQCLGLKFASVLASITNSEDYESWSLFNNINRTQIAPDLVHVHKKKVNRSSSFFKLCFMILF